MGKFLESTGCGQTTTNALGKDGQIIKIPLQSGKNLHYNGPNLPGTGIRTCDDLNTALSKIDSTILKLKEDVYKIQQTLKFIEQ